MTKKNRLVRCTNWEGQDAIPIAHLIGLLAGCFLALPIFAHVDVYGADFCEVRLEDAQNPLFDVDGVTGELKLISWVGAVVPRGFFLVADEPTHMLMLSRECVLSQ